ncbi:MAG TPA: glycosyltransferase family 4 protein [Ignavibacteriaceae bacterium]|nr:glycosyltransferase family 4 protein [Ignavibacteriaceae bacterium]
MSKKTAFIIGRYYETEQLQGGEKFTKRLFKELPQNDAGTYFVDFYRGYKLKDIILKIFGEEELARRGNIIFYRLGIIKIFKYLIRYKPGSIFLSNLEAYGIFFMFFKSILNIKIFYMVHSIYKYELIHDRKNQDKISVKMKLGFAERLFINNSYCLFYLSPETIDLIKEYYKITKQKLCLVTHGIDECFFYNKRSITSGNQPLNLVYSGGFGRELKGFDFLISSLKLANFPINLNICGNIQFKEEFNEALSGFPENIKVKVHGYLTSKELADLYQECDIYLLPSKFETLSIATLEAMASSLVPIVTSNTGVTKYIQNKKNGIIIDYGKPDNFIPELMELNNNREKLLDLSLAAFDSVREITWGKVAANYFQYLSIDK